MGVDFQDTLRTQHHDEQREADRTRILNDHEFTTIHGPSGFHAARCDCGTEFIARDAAGIDRQHENHLEQVLDGGEDDLAADLWAAEPTTVPSA